VTPVITLHDILVVRVSREFDQTRRVKRLLAQLITKPYWRQDQRHIDIGEYLFNNVSVSGQSIAEACKRDKVVLSYIHNDFQFLKLSVFFRNGAEILIDNLVRQNHYYQLLLSRGLIQEFSL